MSEAKEKKDRIYYFDNIKGILIIFTMIFHSISVGDNVYHFNDYFGSSILFFLIPGFIFVTGYFCAKSRRNPLMSALKMFIIYVILQLLISFYYADVLHIIDSHWDLLNPRYTLWYLLTCVYCYILSVPIKKIGFKWSLIISIVIALLVGFVDVIGEEMSISRTLVILPFFILGMYSQSKKIFEFIKKYWYVWLILSAIILTVYLIYPVPNGIIYGKYAYSVMYDNSFEGLLKRIMMYGVNIVFTCLIFSLAPNNKTKLVVLGMNTLIIYVAHGVVLKTIVILMPLPNGALIGTIILFVLSATISVLIGIYLGKLTKYFKNKKRMV